MIDGKTKANKRKVAMEMIRDGKERRDETDHKSLGEHVDRFDVVVVHDLKLVYLCVNISMYASCACACARFLRACVN